MIPDPRCLLFTSSFHSDAWLGGYQRPRVGQAGMLRSLHRSAARSHHLQVTPYQWLPSGP